MQLNLLIQIAGLAALISFIYLAITAIGSLKKMGEFVEEMKPTLNKLSKDVEELKEKSIETMANADETSKSVKSLVQTVEENVNEISGAIQPFKQLANDVYHKVYSPVNNTAITISAISKAFHAFTDRIKK